MKKRGLAACAAMIPKTETSGDDAAEEWSTLVNWVEDPAIKAERRFRLDRAWIKLQLISKT